MILESLYGEKSNALAFCLIIEVVKFLINCRYAPVPLCFNYWKIVSVAVLEISLIFVEHISPNQYHVVEILKELFDSLKEMARLGFISLSYQTAP